MGDKIIKESQHLKYLGVHLSQNLNWKYLIKQQNTQPVMAIFRKAMGSVQGLSLKSRKCSTGFFSYNRIKIHIFKRLFKKRSNDFNTNLIVFSYVKKNAWCFKNEKTFF